MKSFPTIQIAIADSELLLVNLLAGCLASKPDLSVSFTCSSGNALIRELDQRITLPDVILLELQMGDGNGLEVLRALQNKPKRPKVIVLSNAYKLEYTSRLLKEGANAYKSKSLSPEKIVATIRQVAEIGHAWTNAQMEIIQRSISSKTPQVPCSPKERFTSRELEVLALLCHQMTTQEIAESLFLSAKTIETYKSNLILKTGVRNSLGLVLFAIQSEMVNPYEIILLET